MGFWDAVASAGPYAKQSAHRSRQTTTPTPRHLIFTGRLLFLTPNQQCQSSEATYPGKGAVWALGRNVPLIRFFILMLYISFASYIVCFATYTFFFFLTYLLPYLSFPLRIDPFPRQML